MGSVKYDLTTSVPFLAGFHFGILFAKLTASLSSSGSTPLATSQFDMLPSFSITNLTITLPEIPLFCAPSG